MPRKNASTTDDRTVEPVSITGAIAAGEPPRRTRTSRAHTDERGEGVISTAVAVLIVAFLGAAMWLSFQGMFATATDNTRSQVEQIGR